MKLILVSMPVQDTVTAHEIYTKKLGFISKEFNAESSIAVVVSPEDPHGTAILLEPCKDTFAENYQKSAYNANLPVMVFEVNNPTEELDTLAKVGVKIRPDLDNPDYGMKNIFEDGCGNLLMLVEKPS